MKRTLSLVTMTCIFAWLMPLGAFIKPAQEKTACDGRRAFHMCSMTPEKVESPRERSSKVSISSSSGFNENAKSSGSGGDEFLTMEPARFLSPIKEVRYFSRKNPPYLFFPSPIDWPPEARPLA